MYSANKELQTNFKWSFEECYTHHGSAWSTDDCFSVSIIWKYYIFTTNEITGKHFFLLGHTPCQDMLWYLSVYFCCLFCNIHFSHIQHAIWMLSLWGQAAVEYMEPVGQTLSMLSSYSCNTLVHVDGGEGCKHTRGFWQGDWSYREFWQGLMGHAGILIGDWLTMQGFWQGSDWPYRDSDRGLTDQTGFW